MNKTRKIAIAALACILLLMAMFGAAYLGELFKHPELAEFNEEFSYLSGLSKDDYGFRRKKHHDIQASGEYI